MRLSETRHLSRVSLSVEELGLVLAELTPRLVEGRIGRSHQPETDTLVLEVLPRGAPRLFLLISVRSGMTRIHTLPRKPRNPPRPRRFQMLLRKQIDGSRVRAVEQLPGDRVIRLELTRGVTVRTLIAELSGRHGNVFLLDETETILGSLLPNRSRQRDLVVRQPYEAPRTRPPVVSAPARLPVEGADRAARELYECLESRRSMAAEQTTVLSTLRSELARTRRLYQAIAGDLERARRAPDWERYGHALKASLGQVPRGARSVLLPDYTSTGAPALEVPLDPALSPVENMRRCFRMHRKYKDAAKGIAARLEEVRKARGVLEDLQERACAARSLGELQAIAAEIPIRPGRRRPGRSSSGKAQTTTGTRRRALWRTYRAGCETQILVGRDSQGNDALTFGHARGRDFWLHVKAYSGSHVVIRSSGVGPPPAEVLLDAALLAVHFSTAPDNDVHEVACTQVKHVQKPRGALPGAVTYLHETTMRVRPDPPRLQRLLAGAR